jgi:hypothetical protein
VVRQIQKNLVLLWKGLMKIIWLIDCAILLGWVLCALQLVHNYSWVGCWHIILQVYVSVLYLQLPDYFRIILRGQEVKRHSIAADIIYPECISYKPQIGGRQEVCLLNKNTILLAAPHCLLAYYLHRNKHGVVPIPLVLISLFCTCFDWFRLRLLQPLDS